MGLMSWILGGGAKQAAAAVGQVAGVFKPNAEASEARGHAYDGAEGKACICRSFSPSRLSR